MTLDVSTNIQFIHILTPLSAELVPLWLLDDCGLTFDGLLINFFPGLGGNNGLETNPNTRLFF